jgi:predicted metal-dependent phosphoesterase TrpH
MWRSQNIVNGMQRAYEIWPWTTETIIQQGNSVGFNGWYTSGATPTPLIDAQYEHLDRRVIEVGNPIHMGYSWLYYPMRWRFEFEVPTYIIAYPTGNQPLYTNGYYVPRAAQPPIQSYS